MITTPNQEPSQQVSASKFSSPSGRLGGVSLIFACVLVALSLFMPPPGEVDTSVIYVFAQLLIFAASMFGLDAVIKDGFKILPRLPTRK